MHISYEVVKIGGLARGPCITGEVFKSPEIKTHGEEEVGESEAAGCEVEGIVEPGEVRCKT